MKRSYFAASPKKTVKTAQNGRRATKTVWGASKYRHEAIELAKRIVRISTARCERCNKTDKLQGSHIYSVGAHRDMGAMTSNILCLCAGCHIFWWHKEPLEAATWFQKKYPNRAQELLIRSQRIEKQDWANVYSLLKEELKALN